MKLQGFSHVKTWIALWAGGALLIATTVLANSTTQQQAQQQSKQENEKGAKIAKLISVATVALGSFQIYQGYTQIKKGKADMATGETNVNEGLMANAWSTTGRPGDPLIQTGEKQIGEGKQGMAQGSITAIQGSMTVMQGMQGLAGAAKLAQNAATAGRNLGQLDSLSKNSADNIKIDPSFMREGEAGKILDKFEKSLGIPRDALLNALDQGKDPFDMLEKAGVPKDVLNASRLKAGEALASGASVDTKKFGLDPAAIAAKFGEGEFSFGGGSFRSPASDLAGLTNFDDLLNTSLQENQTGPTSGGIDPNSIGLSEDVQNAMNRAGLTEKTLFEMVSKRYKARTPFMFGIDQSTVRKPAAMENTGLTPDFGETL